MSGPVLWNIGTFRTAERRVCIACVRHIAAVSNVKLTTCHTVVCKAQTFEKMKVMFLIEMLNSTYIIVLYFSTI